MNELRSPQQKLETAQKLANQFVEARINKALKEIESSLDGDGEMLAWSRDRAKKTVGHWFAMAYAIGYMDGAENKTVQKIYV